MYFEIFLLAIALAVDALAMTFISSMVYKHEKREKLLIMSGAFGVFQGLMPLLGYFFIKMSKINLGKYTGLLLFLIFGFLSARMFFDFFFSKNGKKSMPLKLTYSWIILQAFLTSVDAMAAGISVSTKNGNIWLSALIIALITFFLCTATTFLGKKAGKIFANSSNFISGILLLILAIHNLLN